MLVGRHLLEEFKAVLDVVDMGLVGLLAVPDQRGGNLCFIDGKPVLEHCEHLLQRVGRDDLPEYHKALQVEQPFLLLGQH